MKTDREFMEDYLVVEKECEEKIKKEILPKLDIIWQYFIDDEKYVNGNIDEEQFNRSHENARKALIELKKQVGASD